MGVVVKMAVKIFVGSRQSTPGDVDDRVSNGPRGPGRFRGGRGFHRDREGPSFSSMNGYGRLVISLILFFSFYDENVSSGLISTG